MPLYHLVGALDPITPADVTKPVGDGLPEALGEWILRDGLTHLKIKLNGDDLTWDVDRVVAVNWAAEEAQRHRGVNEWWYSLDFNERCESVEYLLAFLRHLRERAPAAYDRVQYIEQPTARDLKANPQNKMHEAAKLKPVVIDESLLDLETLHLSRAMGYVADAFDERALEALPGHIAIGHTRYSTAGESKLANAQPLLIDCAHGQMAICHNGNLVNASELRDELVQNGSIFQSTSDTEVVVHLYARSRAAGVEDAVIDVGPGPMSVTGSPKGRVRK